MVSSPTPRALALVGRNSLLILRYSETECWLIMTLCVWWLSKMKLPVKFYWKVCQVSWTLWLIIVFCLVSNKRQRINPEKRHSRHLHSTHTVVDTSGLLMLLVWYLLGSIRGRDDGIASYMRGEMCVVSVGKNAVPDPGQVISDKIRLGRSG